MSYTCALSLKKIKDYLAGAAVVGFDFETSPIEEYRSEERAALDAHKAAITGVSLSVSEDSGIYIPLRPGGISKSRRRSWTICGRPYLRTLP